MVDCDSSFQSAYSLHFVVSTAKRNKKQKEKAVSSSFFRLFLACFSQKAKVIGTNIINDLK
jgi:hypothetical protein